MGNAYGEYAIGRQDPLGDRYDKINANYGQFRGRDGTYKAHDGMDYRAGIGTPIYPVSPGTAHVYPTHNPGWGKYVDVDHGGYYTRYTHLDSMSVSDGQWVTATTAVGVSGKTNGGVNPRMGPHLHFGFGKRITISHNSSVPKFETLYAHLNDFVMVTDDKGGQRLLRSGDKIRYGQVIGAVGSTGNSSGPHLHFQVGSQATGGHEENPIAAGLPQPYSTVDTSRIVGNKAAIYQSDEHIRIIGPDKYGVFHEERSSGENEEVNVPEPNVTYKIIAEA